MGTYSKRIAAGLCGPCGGQPAPGKKTCEACGTAEREKRITRRAERRQAGNCIVCGEPAGEFSRCEKCRGNELARHKQRYVAKKEAGLCPQCSTPVTDSVLCEECQKAQTGSNARYHRNKAAGVCTSCGRESGGKLKCPKCTRAVKEIAHRHYVKKVTAGMCILCNRSPAREGKTTCDECTAKQNAAGKARWEARRLAAINAYGGPVCVGCGYSDIDVLELDHENGGGGDHRRKIGHGNLYRWLEENNYPPGFRVLCPTCNRKAYRGTLAIDQEKLQEGLTHA